MKAIKSILLMIFMASVVSTSSAFRYSVSVTRSDGSRASGETVDLEFSLSDSEGRTLYTENHPGVEVNTLGFAEVEIGSGSVSEGSFDAIDWSEPNLKADILFKFSDGTTAEAVLPFSTVPHALAADEAGGMTAFSGNDKFTLAVDDDGNLSTVKTSGEIIPIPEGYTKMIFHDEFDVDGMPNPEYWGYEEGYVRGGEMQYYTVARPENAYIKDGKLHIVTLNDNWQDETGQTHQVTSASVMSKDKVKFKYGRVDIRAKIPICLGSWPALWMMPNDDVYGYWPNSGEIDIIEHVGFTPYTIYFTAHCAEQNGANNKYHHSTTVPTCTTEFHVYSLVWTPDRIDWLVDDRRCWTITRTAPTWRGWPYNQDFYLIMNTAFGGSWGAQKGVDLEALPITFEIDYVRIFQ